MHRWSLSSFQTIKLLFARTWFKETLPGFGPKRIKKNSNSRVLVDLILHRSAYILSSIDKGKVLGGSTRISFGDLHFTQELLRRVCLVDPIFRELNRLIAKTFKTRFVQVPYPVKVFMSFPRLQRSVQLVSFGFFDSRPPSASIAENNGWFRPSISLVSADLFSWLWFACELGSWNGLPCLVALATNFWYTKSEWCVGGAIVFHTFLAHSVSQRETVTRWVFIDFASRICRDYHSKYRWIYFSFDNTAMQLSLINL